MNQISREPLLIFCILIFSSVCWPQSKEIKKTNIPPDLYDKVAPTLARVECNKGNSVGTGSTIGISNDENLFILTACHVVAKNFESVQRDPRLKLEFYDDITVNIGEQKNLEAIVLKYLPDANNDLVLLESAPAGEQKTIKYNHSDKISPPVEIVAFGFPETGVPDLTIGNLKSAPAPYFTFTADVKGGNSGGPLTDFQGRMVGMITSIRGKEGRALQMNHILSFTDNWLTELEDQKRLKKKWKREKHTSLIKRPIFIASVLVSITAATLFYVLCRTEDPEESFGGPPGPPDSP